VAIEISARSGESDTPCSAPRVVPPVSLNPTGPLPGVTPGRSACGSGWDDYAAARAQVIARLGSAPITFPGTPNDPYWEFIRRLYFYDPGPILRQLQAPVLALFGELDDNILAVKNKNALEAALKAGNNRDYTLRIIPKANHLQLEAGIGSNAEMASLRRFAPAYFTTVQDWLAKRITSFRASR
jgi:pimeloyl-ACP methyl ester carboxylesterase